LGHVRAWPAGPVVEATLAAEVEEVEEVVEFNIVRSASA